MSMPRDDDWKAAVLLFMLATLETDFPPVNGASRPTVADARAVAEFLLRQEEAEQARLAACSPVHMVGLVG